MGANIPKFSILLVPPFENQYPSLNRKTNCFAYSLHFKTHVQ